VTIAAGVLIWAGVLVVVLSAVAALALPPVHARLHALSPVTSLGGPLIGVGLALANGLNLTTATVLLIVILLAITGPVLVVAMARVAAEQDAEPESRR
jgi:monovalent cation/proton antiporter MnhG/PhaG subunit